jgi:hypothetical protein
MTDYNGEWSDEEGVDLTDAAFTALRAQLVAAFSAPDVTYVRMSAEDVIARNAKPYLL